MQILSTTVLVALCFASSTLSTPLVKRQNGVTCQTSDGSPSTTDVTYAINQLRGGGGSCPQTNSKASDCTTLVTKGSAAISVCGGVDDASSALSCADVAGYADQIQQTCLSDNRAGGTYTVSASKRVEVINSSDV